MGTPFVFFCDTFVAYLDSSVLLLFKQVSVPDTAGLLLLLVHSASTDHESEAAQEYAKRSVFTNPSINPSGMVGMSSRTFACVPSATRVAQALAHIYIKIPPSFENAPVAEGPPLPQYPTYDVQYL